MGNPILSSYGLTEGSIQNGKARIIEEKRKMNPPIKSENDDIYEHSCPTKLTRCLMEVLSE